MDQVTFSQYMFSTLMADEQSLSALGQLYDEYPASSAVAFAYVKMLRELHPEQYELQKKKLLLAIISRPAFQQLAPVRMELDKMDEKKKDVSPEVSKVASQVIEEEPEFIDELIDKFTENAPKIQYDPEKHDSAINYGKPSCVENPELVSETLALIFAQQNYYGKAVKIYKKLCLQNPEKSSYFAAQIEKLKVEKNNNNKTE